MRLVVAEERLYGPFVKAAARRRYRPLCALANYAHYADRGPRIAAPLLAGRGIGLNRSRHSFADGVEVRLHFGRDHESATPTHCYVDADLAMKEKALSRLNAPDPRMGRYRALDALMRILPVL